LNRPKMDVSTRTLTGTAVLGALVVVFDYTIKFSGLKIPFIPPLQFLHFDFTGVPVVLSLLLFDLVPGGAVTSAVAFFAIFARSGSFVGPVSKALAEFSTILGVALGYKWIRSPVRLTKKADIWGAWSFVALSCHVFCESGDSTRVLWNATHGGASAESASCGVQCHSGFDKRSGRILDL